MIPEWLHSLVAAALTVLGERSKPVQSAAEISAAASAAVTYLYEGAS